MSNAGLRKDKYNRRRFAHMHTFLKGLAQFTNRSFEGEVALLMPVPQKKCVWEWIVVYCIRLFKIVGSMQWDIVTTPNKTKGPSRLKSREDLQNSFYSRV